METLFQQISECSCGIASIVHNLFLLPFGVAIELFSLFFFFLQWTILETSDNIRVALFYIMN